MTLPVKNDLADKSYKCEECWEIIKKGELYNHIEALFYEKYEDGEPLEDDDEDDEDDALRARHIFFSSSRRRRRNR